MARQDQTVTDLIGSKSADYGTANAADVTMTAADVANKEQFTLTGDEIVIAWNSGASAHNITITSVEDSDGRTGNITDYEIGADEIAVFGPFDLDGWQQSDLKLYFEADDAEVYFGVIRGSMIRE